MPHVGDNRTLKHGCIVMASGAGVRFGGNKLMAELCGEPLVGHVVRATDGLFDRRVVVTRHADVAALCETLGAKVILHDEPGRNDTVRLGMEAMDRCDTVTFVQGDQPLIRPASIAALLRAAERDAAAEHDAAAERDAAAAAALMSLLDVMPRGAMPPASRSMTTCGAMLRGAALQMFRGVPVRALGVHVSMARRARLCFFLPGRSTNSVLFLMVRAAASWQKCMRNTFEPSRFQASGNCSTWIRVTTCSSYRHMLRGAACRFAALSLFGALIPPSRNDCVSLLSLSPPRSFRPFTIPFVCTSINPSARTSIPPFVTYSHIRLSVHSSVYPFILSFMHE